MIRTQAVARTEMRLALAAVQRLVAPTEWSVEKIYTSTAALLMITGPRAARRRCNELILKSEPGAANKD